MSNQITLIPSSAEWSQIIQMCGVLVKSGFLPQSIKTPEQAAAIALKGRELGIPPMQSFAQISVIQGKPALGAELMLARIYERYPNADIEIVKREADGCTIKARRGSTKKYAEFTFTTADAERAKLMGKDSWRNYPRSMCYWRAVSDMARAMWPECLAGCSHTPEELGAEVNEEGDVIDVPAFDYNKPSAPQSPTTNVVKAANLEVVDDTQKPIAARTAPIYNNDDAKMQTAVANALRNQKPKIDESIWESIGLKLHGRPTTDLKAAIKEVLENLKA